MPRRSSGLGAPPPTMDEYIRAATHLANVVDRLVNGGRVRKAELRAALDAYRRIDFRAM